MPKRKPKYASTPKAPSSKIADSKLIKTQTGGLGDNPTTMGGIVPKAIAGGTRAFNTPGRAPRSSGHSLGQGSRLRVSGNPAAHHIGKSKI